VLREARCPNRIAQIIVHLPIGMAAMETPRQHGGGGGGAAAAAAAAAETGEEHHQAG